MTQCEFDLTGAQVLLPEGLAQTRLSFAEGGIVSEPVGRTVDLSGYLILPGIIDMHGDGFERHVAVRRGALRDMQSGLLAAEAELAANGITTAMLAQFYSWEGGMRGPEFATRVLTAWQQMRDTVATDLQFQLRFETHMLDDYAGVEAMLTQFSLRYVVFNDHLPHAALERGKRPARLTGQALKSGRNPEAHLALMQALHDRRGEVEGAITELARRLTARGILLGSHDDTLPQDRRAWRARAVRIAEFPETSAAAQEARDGGDGIVLGAPNVMRGASHAGNVSAREVIAQGNCDALASDYHYPAPRLAALELARDIGLPAAWDLVSRGPARLLGLDDRGALAPGLRADILVVDPDSGRVGATIAAGRVTYLAGDVAARFLA